MICCWKPGKCWQKKNKNNNQKKMKRLTLYSSCCRCLLKFYFRFVQFQKRAGGTAQRKSNYIFVFKIRATQSSLSSSESKPVRRDAVIFFIALRLNSPSRGFSSSSESVTMPFSTKNHSKSEGHDYFDQTKA